MANQTPLTPLMPLDTGYDTWGPWGQPSGGMTMPQSFASPGMSMGAPTMQAPNPWLNAGLSVGTSLLGGIAGLFRGKSPEEKRAEEVYSLAKNRLGQSVIEPDQYLADYMRSMAPQWNQQAEGINRRLGLDSGVAQGEMMAMQQSPIAQFMLNARQQADILKHQSDQSLLSLMASLGRG